MGCYELRGNLNIPFSGCKYKNLMHDVKKHESLNAKRTTNHVFDKKKSFQDLKSLTEPYTALV